MSLSLHLKPDDRVLVFAPHPDDETLATGELIQAALAIGACVRVVFATDGDNNAWPQRWLERRWRIGPVERARWGKRRRREALAALSVLGVKASSARFLGWPDQGLTQSLMRDDGAIEVLSEEISTFLPTHVAMPVLADRHPDHSALRVMLDLALLRTAIVTMRLGYGVHGLRAATNPRIIGADPARAARKQQAMCTYASQVALSRRRLLTIAARPECFDVVERGASATPLAPRSVLCIRPQARPSVHREELLVVLAAGQQLTRFSVPLSSGHGRVSPSAGSVATSPPTRWREGLLQVTLPEMQGPITAVYTKRERIGSRLLIFDREGWSDTKAQRLASLDANVGTRVATSVG